MRIMHGVRGLTFDTRFASQFSMRIELMKRMFFRLFVIGLPLSLAFFWLSANRISTSAAPGSSGAPYTNEWRITGPSGGDVRGLVVDPNDPERFYFGTLDGQIYTSTDGARNW